MKCTCIFLSPSAVNHFSVSLAIQLSLLHFKCMEDAKKGCLALSPSLHRRTVELLLQYREFRILSGASLRQIFVALFTAGVIHTLLLCIPTAQPWMTTSAPLSCDSSFFQRLPPTCGTCITAGHSQLLPFLLVSCFIGLF